MPDNEKPKSLDARRQEAVREIEKRLVEMGVNPDAAETRAADIAGRLYFGDNGPARALKPHSRGDFYPGDWNDPLGALVSEVFHGIGPEEKLVAEEQRAAEVQAITDAKRASGTYDFTL